MLDFGEDESYPTEFPQSDIVAEHPSTPVSVPHQPNTTNEDRAAARRLASAERVRKYRASLSEEKKAQIREKDNARKRLHIESLSVEQRTEMRRKNALCKSLQRIKKRVASTDFTYEEISEVNIHKQHILLLLKLPNI